MRLNSARFSDRKLKHRSEAQKDAVETAFRKSVLVLYKKGRMHATLVAAFGCLLYETQLFLAVAR